MRHVWKIWYGHFKITELFSGDWSTSGDAHPIIHLSNHWWAIQSNEHCFFKTYHALNTNTAAEFGVRNTITNPVDTVFLFYIRPHSKDTSQNIKWGKTHCRKHTQLWVNCAENPWESIPTSMTSSKMRSAFFILFFLSAQRCVGFFVCLFVFSFLFPFPPSLSWVASFPS